MSETVKLIIEIPKEDYLAFSELSEKEKANELSYYERIIANGIPLEDVKAEIDKQEFAHHQGLTHWYMTPSEVKSVVFEILDNIGKAESEE